MNNLLSYCGLFDVIIGTPDKDLPVSGLREEIHFYMVKMGISILPDILMESIKNSQLPQGPPPQVNIGYQIFF